jgi:pyrimidine-specific ribonucleoside hydrolase
MTRDRLLTAAQKVRRLSVLAVLSAIAIPCAAHDEELRSPLIIETDLGIDDVVSLAIAFQSPTLEIAAVIAGEGVAAPATANEQLGRLLDYFNRGDVPQYRPMEMPTGIAPECRARVEAVIGAALPDPARAHPRPFTPWAYTVDEHRSTVLALGPLTQLAAALGAEPEIAGGIRRIIVAGDPERSDSWNLVRDPDAVFRVRETGIPMIFVRPGPHAEKPGVWSPANKRPGGKSSLGASLVERMVESTAARDHNHNGLSNFHDELAVLYLVMPEAFEEVSPGIVQPAASADAADAIAELLCAGRQHKDRVVFVDGPLPAEVLQPDVQARREVILANNGPDEWFAQLLLNELHEHLGAYSIIGVKMGLRAAELLNAPQHAMKIVSSAPPTQPVSCLNDGLLVSTGSTPGRGLFTHQPGPPGTVEASFSYNHRTIKLRLKDSYRAQIGAAIQEMLGRYTLEDEGYWLGVRELGLDIWQNWHRCDLFAVVSVIPADDSGER